MIEISLLQNLRTFQSDLRSTGQTRRKRYKSGKILPEIQHVFFAGRMDQLGCKPLVLPDGHIIGSGRNDGAGDC